MLRPSSLSPHPRPESRPPGSKLDLRTPGTTKLTGANGSRRNDGQLERLLGDSSNDHSMNADISRSFDLMSYFPYVSEWSVLRGVVWMEA